MKFTESCLMIKVTELLEMVPGNGFYAQNNVCKQTFGAKYKFVRNFYFMLIFA